MKQVNESGLAYQRNHLNTGAMYEDANLFNKNWVLLRTKSKDQTRRIGR